MSAYRDRFERCPRCDAALASAGSVQACEQCGGHWVDADVLREMAEAMVIPPRPITIELAPHRAPKLACPACEVPMETWTLHGVAIDRCEAHGLWFDRAELQTVLYAASGQPADERPQVHAEVSALAELLERDESGR